MTFQRTQQIPLRGFVMAYLGMMSVLLTVGVVVLGRSRAKLIEFLFLPAALFGCDVITIGKWHKA
jgi:hypothetical protein